MTHMRYLILFLLLCTSAIALIKTVSGFPASSFSQQNGDWYDNWGIDRNNAGTGGGLPGYLPNLASETLGDNIEPPPAVKGCRVLIVDEICSSGETIAVVKQKVESLGARAVRSAVLYAHTGSAALPDYIGLITDALLLNPWDREVLKDGTFQFHPEYVEALGQQGIQADSSLLIDAPVVEIAKG